MPVKQLFGHVVSYVLLGLGLLGVCFMTAFFGVTQFSASAHPATNQSFVRVLHASPDVGTADVFVDGAKLLSSFAFGGITGYAAIPAGPHKVQIALVGKGIGASVISETLMVEPGFAYTVAAIGTQATGLSLEVFIDNNILAPGTAKLRVYQLSPNAGAVTAAANGKTLLSGITYQNASNYLDVPAGGYTFNVTSSTSSTALTASTTLGANMVTSLFVVGMFQGTPQSQLITTQVQGLPGMPNTGSDPTAIPYVDAAAPLSPWTWPLGLASLLLIGSGVYLRRVTAKRS